MWASARAMQSSVRNDRARRPENRTADTVARFFRSVFANGRSGQIAKGAEKK
jgi:hypothetical protein